MRAGKLVHRVVSAEQAEVLRQAIANYRRLKKLLRGWESVRVSTRTPSPSRALSVGLWISVSSTVVAAPARCASPADVKTTFMTKTTPCGASRRLPVPSTPRDHP
jgi:hypothetical protein